MLIEIIGQLASEFKPVPHSAKLDDIKAILTIVDGTLLKALPKTVEALWGDRNANAFKAHVQYELLKAVPAKFQLADGKVNEKDESQLCELTRCFAGTWVAGQMRKS